MNKCTSQIIRDYGVTVIYDIPYDLVNACVKAIDDSSYEGLSLVNSWNGVVNTDGAGN